MLSFPRDKDLMHKGEKEKIYCASVFKMNQLNIKSQHMSLGIPVCVSFKALRVKLNHGAGILKQIFIWYSVDRKI